MIIQAPDAPKAQQLAQQLARQLDPKDPLHPVYVQADRLALAGIKELPAKSLALLQQAGATILDKRQTAVRASRLLHPQNTVIKTPHSEIGGPDLTLMAGPDAIESPEHVLAMGQAAKAAGATILRGGAFKPRTSPYSYQGSGEAGLKALRMAADQLEMDVVTEIMDSADLALIDPYTDIFQVGTRNMQNFALLKALGRQTKPVLLKRGMSASIDDFLNAAEYILAGGNQAVILMERGIRTFDHHYTRNTFDVGAIPVLKRLTHLPILADSSHATGDRRLVTPVALAAVAAGAQGLMTELHDHPANALVDGAQAITPATYQTLTRQAVAIHQVVEQDD
ncbi:3-deoxy-7-phosphoheptulonate synthase [Weissella halotolerans]|uniref:3-deoxy-7-phosphoheptulonate synthase n=1 Tax=Weissella halotolerans DSM 20190 TaxID=1123500 RepID=A0A0R2G8G9_9LACO|nr:3-deoxy-7-phosphoheptulonate synthase [Weissella halotolerans]KRN33482.1 3-deoxy-7-phosphoheptulonate synthase [Weissella halotolerans DSM 20190]